MFEVFRITVLFFLERRQEAEDSCALEGAEQYDHWIEVMSAGKGPENANNERPLPPAFLSDQFSIRALSETRGRISLSM